MDLFCIAGNGRSLIERGLTSGLFKPNAVLEHSTKRFAEIASAMALLAMVTSAECARLGLHGDAI